jgi:hypothetical protein
MQKTARESREWTRMSADELNHECTQRGGASTKPEGKEMATKGSEGTKRSNADRIFPLCAF